MEKPELIILVGPPCSGKSTLAGNLKHGSGDWTVQTHAYINQDSQGKHEHLINFEYARLQKQSIIVDRMNFNKEQRSRYLDKAKKDGYSTKIIVLHQPKMECVRRGLNRLEMEIHPTIKNEDDLKKAINFFFSHYERPSKYEADTVEYHTPMEQTRANAIIVDLDGTLCNIEHRLHFVKDGKKDWKNFMLPDNIIQDQVNNWCKKIIDSMKQDNIIVLCSGRPDNLRKVTEEWLKTNKIHYDHLLMRPRDDHRQDAIVKEIILDFEILPMVKPIFAIDDRTQVVDMWRKRGIVTLQCADGNF
jgi:adenylate kinase family enzyme